MIDSFIIGVGTALIGSLVVFGWKFFHIKEPTYKQLIIRVIIGGCIALFNVVAIIMLIVDMSILEESFSIVFFSIITFLIPLIIVARILYKDIMELIQRKKQNQNESNDID